MGVVSFAHARCNNQRVSFASASETHVRVHEVASGRANPVVTLLVDLGVILAPL